MLYEEVSVWQKIYYLFLFRPYYLIPMYILYSVLNKDLTYLNIFYKAIGQAITKKFSMPEISGSKIKYQVNSDPTNPSIYKKFSLFTDVIIPKQHIKFLNDKSEYVYLKQCR